MDGLHGQRVGTHGMYVTRVFKASARLVGIGHVRVHCMIGMGSDASLN